VPHAEQRAESRAGDEFEKCHVLEREAFQPSVTPMSFVLYPDATSGSEQPHTAERRKGIAEAPKWKPQRRRL
jgi:hypothetical protein